MSEIEQSMQPLTEDSKDTLQFSPMASGRGIDPWNVKPEDIYIEDMARGLANLNRFNGQFGGYSVAQHSVLVSRICPPHLQLAGLLHDGPEYITGDLVHHVKHGPGFLGMLWNQLDAPIQAAIEVRFGLEPNELYDPAVKDADYRIFNMEWECLVQGKIGPGASIFRPWPALKAEGEFLGAFNRYTGRA